MLCSFPEPLSSLYHVDSLIKGLQSDILARNKIIKTYDLTRYRYRRFIHFSKILICVNFKNSVTKATECTVKSFEVENSPGLLKGYIQSKIKIKSMNPKILDS